MAKEKISSGETTKTKQSTARKTASPTRLKVVSDSASASGRSAQLTEPSSAELDQMIRLRAYEFFMERGGQHGAHEEDWHRAEREVRDRMARRTATALGNTGT